MQYKIIPIISIKAFNIIQSPSNSLRISPLSLCFGSVFILALYHSASLMMHGCQILIQELGQDGVGEEMLVLVGVN